MVFKAQDSKIIFQESEKYRSPETAHCSLPFNISFSLRTLTTSYNKTFVFYVLVIGIVLNIKVIICMFRFSYRSNIKI